MMIESNGITDLLAVTMERARGMACEAGLRGHGAAVLTGPDGVVKAAVPFTNLITTQGDAYYAAMGIALVGTPNEAQPAEITGMKLGTGTTTPTKSGAASFLVAYISGSNKALDTSYPQTSAVGTDVGYYATYRCVWAAGEATATGIAEAVLCTDSGTNDGGSAAETISRAKFSAAFDKSAGDTLTVTWNHLFLGA